MATVGTGTTATLAVGDVITATGIGTSGNTITVTTQFSLTTTPSTITTDVSGFETGTTVGPISATVATSGGTNVPATVAGAFTLDTTSGSKTAILRLTAVSGATVAATVPAGSIVTSANLPSNDYVVSTSASAVTDSAPATLTLAKAATATATLTAATVNATSSTTVAPSFGEGSTTPVTFYVSGSGFAADGGNVSMTSSNPDLVFSSITELSSTLLVATVTTKASTTSGSASITLTDNNGTSTALAGALTVTPAPTVTSISVTSIPANQATGTAFTITGTNIEASTSDTITFTSLVDGTSLEVSPSSTWSSTTQGSPTATPTSTSISGYVWGKNATTQLSATAGNYSVTVTNADGGSVTSGAIFAVSGFGATSISPSSVKATATAVPVTITGSGFQSGAVVATSCSNVTIVANTTVLNNPNSISFSVTTNGATPGECAITVTNPNTGSGNGAVSTINLGIGAYSSTSAPSITSVTMTPTTPLPVGTGEGGSNPVAASMSIVGTGFDPNNGVTLKAYVGTSTTQDNNITGTCTVGAAGTSMLCSIVVASGASAGAHSITVTNSGTSGTTSSAFAGAVTIAGPAITAQSPAAIPVNAPIGTVITLTGTGFTNTTSATVNANGNTGLAGIFAVVSPTSATLTVTGSPTAASPSNPASIVLSQILVNGSSVQSSPFYLTISAAPQVTGNITYVTGTTGVGAGATAQKIVINGTGFATGVTVTAFTNAYGVADTNVKATVTSVNTAGTTITATVAVPAGDVNISDGYTVTNTDGGTVKVAAFGTGSLAINAGPTITSVTPATVTANSTSAFTIVGTGFTTGSVVSTTGTNATCGADTFVSATQLTVTCTFGAAGSTAVSLVVTNADGGSATSAAVLAAGTPVTPPVTPPAVNLHTTGAHGFAVVGRTVTITITGGGFYGQPTLTSTAVGVRAVVVKDNGKMLTVRVTTTSVRARGWHTFTIRLANGKMAKVNYLTK
jgi:hypothetical protein